MPKCAICRSEYKKWSISQKVCGSVECAKAFAEKERAKKERKEYRARKEKLKSRSGWLADAQTAVNAYIRARDEGKPCISCGRHHSGQNHAGHYRSVGAASHLRFDEENIHLQCQPCNVHKSGNAIEYRIHLIERIGSAAVARLERDNQVKKWTIEEAKEIRDLYRAKLKGLKNGNG
jgi:hypothetical protein